MPAAVREWLGGDLPEFDEADTARRVRDALGAVPHGGPRLASRPSARTLLPGVATLVHVARS